MVVHRTPTFAFTTICVLAHWLAPRPALAQDANEAVQNALIKYLSSFELAQRNIEEVGLSPLDAGHSPGASVLDNAWLKIASSTSGAEYLFPLEFGSRPLSKTRSARPLKRSELRLTYSPLTVTQQTVSGLSTLSNDVGQSGAISYRIPLVDNTLTVQELVAAQFAAIRSSPFLANITDEAMEPAVLSAARTNQAIRDWTNDFWKRFKLATDVAYKANWATDKQDEFAVTVSAEKGVDSGKLLKLSASAGWSDFRAERSLNAYYAARTGVGASVKVAEGIGAALKVATTTYTGDGFTGIRGISDTSRKTDVVLTESVTFQIVVANPLASA